MKKILLILIVIVSIITLNSCYRYQKYSKVYEVGYNPNRQVWEVTYANYTKYSVISDYAVYTMTESFQTEEGAKLFYNSFKKENENE